MKAVLREIANWARPDGVVEFLHIARIAAVVEVSPRTVKRCIAKLEEPTIEHPDRLGLIRRVARFRDDGGQSASGFELIGFQPPFDLTPGDKMSPPPVTHVTPPGDNLSREGVSPVSPLKRDKYNSPPPPKGGVSPPLENSGDEGQEPAGDVLPEDWQMPPIDRLGPKTAALVRQWPPGAWEAVCETFRLHWQAEGGAKGRKRLASKAALEAWAIRDHAKIMRDAKAGVSFVQLVPVLRGGAGGKGSGGQASGPVEPVAAQAREDDRSQAVRRELRRTLGGVIYDQWFAAVALIGDARGLVVIAPSEFQRAWIEDRFSPKILDAGRAVLGSGVRQVRFQVQDIRERAA
ncbi:MAG: DnaA N-terminal domain-containing protein [Erythrobacter sp.]|nr:DnaA N-terminal domain-containing protein [Erythrobacter sp.]MDZ4274221.1 DnaA N-terminal domain-containing protein [Erythrobacter sp.]